MEQVRTVMAHEVPERPPIRIVPGEGVTVGERDTEWPAFAFVTTASGAGWVPARYLSAGAGEATVLRGYDTAELAVPAGVVLDVLERDDESGWLRCRASDGREGWIPVRAVAPVG